MLLLLLSFTGHAGGDRGLGRARKLDREAVLDKAAHLFRERGYAGTSLQDIADEFLVTRPALRHHFPNKLDLLGAIHDRAMTALLAPLDEILATDQDAPSKMAAFIGHHVRSSTETPNVIAVFLQEESEFTPEGLARVLRDKREYSDKVESIYRQGVKEGTFRADLDPKVATYGILGMCNWLHRWFRSEGRYSSEEVARQLTTLVSEGYLRRGPGEQQGGRKSTAKREPVP
jgi:TetR/AcrR family transcriptional regulator, cholesterol catabolism regulator